MNSGAGRGEDHRATCSAEPAHRPWWRMQSGALPSFTTQDAETTAMTPQSNSKTGQQPSSTAGMPDVVVVFQAVDAVLEDWHGHHQRHSTPRKHHR